VTAGLCPRGVGSRCARVWRVAADIRTETDGGTEHHRQKPCCLDRDAATDPLPFPPDCFPRDCFPRDWEPITYGRDHHASQGRSGAVTGGKNDADGRSAGRQSSAEQHLRCDVRLRRRVHLFNELTAPFHARTPPDGATALQERESPQALRPSSKLVTTPTEASVPTLSAMNHRAGELPTLSLRPGECLTLAPEASLQVLPGSSEDHFESDGCDSELPL